MSGLKQPALKFSGPALPHLIRNVLSGLGRSVCHCTLRAGLSGLSLDALHEGFQPEAVMFSLRLVLGGGAFQSALECLAWNYAI